MTTVTSYATLQTVAATMLHREDDTDITDNLPLFIQLCEADLNDRLILKDAESEESLTLTVGNNYVAIPTGYISPIEFWLVIDNERTPPLTAMTPKELPYDSENSIPTMWAIDGVNIRFDCPADDTYSAKFRMVKASNLSVSNTTNYLLLKRPDVYLYGTLKQAALFIQDDAALSKWGAMYEQAIRGLRVAEGRARAIVPLRTDVPTRARSNILTG